MFITDQELLNELVDKHLNGLQALPAMHRLHLSFLLGFFSRHFNAAFTKGQRFELLTVEATALVVSTQKSLAKAYMSGEFDTKPDTEKGNTEEARRANDAASKAPPCDDPSWADDGYNGQDGGLA